MSNKITDARVGGLERLSKFKDELKGKIQRKKAKMQEINDAIERAGTTEVILSSSTAVFINRGKKVPTLTNTDVLNSMDLAIIRLEEQFSNVDKELNQLKKLMESS